MLSCLRQAESEEKELQKSALAFAALFLLYIVNEEKRDKFLKQELLQKFCSSPFTEDFSQSPLVFIRLHSVLHRQGSLLQ